ncbi:hypothetical protein LCGC14_0954870 [marine sediment metagenome]|uniref:Uncharacterized protein n=1 Tax=marine sediment metagenome TaxID=412755 RepID=A0A0F9RML2_9ZZZZ|nr:hypothetical protein [bacterium]
MASYFCRRIFQQPNAFQIAYYKNEYPDDDMLFIEETLFLTYSGHFFLLLSGGPMTKHAVLEDHHITGSTKVQTISKSQAQDWLNEHDL